MSLRFYRLQGFPQLIPLRSLFTSRVGVHLLCPPTQSRTLIKPPLFTLSHDFIKLIISTSSAPPSIGGLSPLFFRCSFHLRLCGKHHSLAFLAFRWAFFQGDLHWAGPGFQRLINWFPRITSCAGRSWGEGRYSFQGVSCLGWRVIEVQLLFKERLVLLFFLLFSRWMTRNVIINNINTSPNIRHSPIQD